MIREIFKNLFGGHVLLIANEKIAHCFHKMSHFLRCFLNDFFPLLFGFVLKSYKDRIGVVVFFIRVFSNFQYLKCFAKQRVTAKKNTKSKHGFLCVES